MALFDSIVDRLPVMGPYYAAKNLSMIADFFIGSGPGTAREYVRKYEWLRARSNRDEEDDRQPDLAHRSPGARAAFFRAATYITYYYTNVLKRMAREPDKFLWHEMLVSPEIFYAMGLVPFYVEMVPIILPNMNSKLTEHYIDVAEGAGYPGDICTLPKTVLGMALEDQLPPPKAIVTSNSPCDGGMAQYAVMEEIYKVPVFRLDLPYAFRERRGMDYYVREIKRMIAWLEDIYSVKMDYDRLREVCEERNRAQAYSLDLWDLQRMSPAPVAGETLIMSHVGYFLGGGTKEATKLLKDVLRIARRTMKRDGGAVPGERHRFVLWNPPPLVFPGMFTWIEKEYGAVGVMDMITYKDHPFIDTSTPESMLGDLAYIMAHGPMAQHTRGPCENFFGDLFYLYESFNADMMVMAGHVGCKNTRALFGMFRELCRKSSIPLLVIDYDLSDTRPMSPNGIKRQMADFMENIMGEKK